MARWRTLDFICNSCNIREFFVEDLDAVEEHKCLACGRVMQQTLGSPKVHEHSWPDGRKREDNYYIEKLARKEEAKAMDLPVEKRKEVRKEVTKIRKEIK